MTISNCAAVTNQYAAKGSCTVDNDGAADLLSEDLNRDIRGRGQNKIMLSGWKFFLGEYACLTR